MMTPAYSIEEYPFHLLRKIAVVVPAYNEERWIAKTLRSIPSWIYQVIVVDDASTDATPAIVAELANDDLRITYTRLEENKGVGAAIVAGYREAQKLGCDIAAVMAGDNQMDPNDLEQVLYPIVAGTAGYCKGNRLDHPEADSIPPVRRFGTAILAKLTCAVGNIGPLNDMQCGYTAIDLTQLPLIDLDSLYSRYGYPNDLVLKLAFANVTITEVTVRPIYQNQESGLIPHKVIIPISKILAKGVVHRIRRRLDTLSPFHS